MITNLNEFRKKNESGGHANFGFYSIGNNQPKPTIKITQGSQKPPVKFVRTSDSRQRSPGDCGCSRKK